MWQIRRELGVEQAIYALATPIGKDPTTQTTDFNFRSVRSAATSQCFIELAYKDSSTGAFLPHDPNSFAGPCFYRDGFITINKERGFGDWYLEEHFEEGRTIDKVTAYVRSLIKKYDLKACYVLNDNGYSEKSVDITEIQNMGIPVIKFVPNAPYLHTYCDSVEIHEDGSGVVHSSKTCLLGMNSCFTHVSLNI